MKAAGFALAFVLFATACASSSNPCTSGFDVRDLDDGGIPQSVKDELFAPGLVIGRSHADYPSGKVVVIRAASPDWEANPAVTKSYVDDVFFDDDASKQTMHGYYRRNSWDQFLIGEGATPDWITVPKKLTSYENGIEDNTEYMRDVLKLANVGWNALDANGDDEISRAEAQIVVLIPNAMPDSGFASVRDVSIGSVATPKGTFDFGSRNILYFSVKATADPNSANEPIRSRQAVAHELAHAFFRLPDRYGDESGTGSYDIMATTYTWTMLTMPDRIRIGWIKPDILDAHEGRCLEFAPSASRKSALILVPPKQLRKATGVLEYWVAEYRNAEQVDGGYDDGLPDAGLAVWYVATGTYSSGWDDVRLVHFDKSDRDPDRYKNPGADALFRRNDGNHRRVLFDRTKQWTLLYFENVSEAGGQHMYAEF